MCAKFKNALSKFLYVEGGGGVKMAVYEAHGGFKICQAGFSV